MNGSPWWETLLLSSAGPAVIATVSILVTARLSQRAVHEAQDIARKAETRADDERNGAEARRRWEQRLGLAGTVVEGLTTNPLRGPVVAGDGRPARADLDCLPEHYFPVHRLLLFPEDEPNPNLPEQLRGRRGWGSINPARLLREEGRVTLKSMVSGHDPPPLHRWAAYLNEAPDHDC